MQPFASQHSLINKSLFSPKGEHCLIHNEHPTIINHVSNVVYDNCEICMPKVSPDYEQIMIDTINTDANARNEHLVTKIFGANVKRDYERRKKNNKSKVNDDMSSRVVSKKEASFDGRISKSKVTLTVKIDKTKIDISDLVRLEKDISSHRQPDESKLNTIYSTSHRKMLSISMSKFFSEIGDKELGPLPSEFRIGTPFANLTNLGTDGYAYPVNKGYFTMESYEGILNAMKLEPNNKDLEVWKRLVEENVAQPRCLDVFDVVILTLQRYLVQAC